MKKLLAVFICLIIISSFFTGCDNKKENVEVLRVYNCEDYISEDDDETEENESCIDAFVEYMASKGRNVKVEYSTFGTLENMYNELLINPNSYDLICPSEYMIQKMMNEGMLEKYTDEFLKDKDNNYNKYASPYIKDLFYNMTTKDANGEELHVSDYAMGYMWGTIGIVYNPEKVDDEDMQDWNGLFMSKYKNKATIKDSIRDTYFMGLAMYKSDELLKLAEDYEKGDIDLKNYNGQLSTMFNDTSEETINGVGEVLNKLKRNVYGFEVDSGKNDMITGKIDINVAWSGDAVYAIEFAEDEGGVELKYAVPKQGSNVWFDGWVMPKGANVELAQEFVNFISSPEIAALNMSYIEYTSVIAGEEILDYVMETYELTSEETEDNLYETDLRYFFNGTLEDDSRAIVYTSELDRMFSTQYPTEEILERCAIMNFFDKDANKTLNVMWEQVKGESLPIWALILITVAILLLAGGIIVYRHKDKIFKVDYEKLKKAEQKGDKVINRELVI